MQNKFIRIDDLQFYDDQEQNKQIVKRQDSKIICELYIRDIYTYRYFFDFIPSDICVAPFSFESQNSVRNNMCIFKNNMPILIHVNILFCKDCKRLVLGEYLHLHKCKKYDIECICEIDIEINYKEEIQFLKNKIKELNEKLEKIEKRFNID